MIYKCRGAISINPPPPRSPSVVEPLQAPRPQGHRSHVHGEELYRTRFVSSRRNLHKSSRRQNQDRQHRRRGKDGHVRYCLPHERKGFISLLLSLSLCISLCISLLPHSLSLPHSLPLSLYLYLHLSLPLSLPLSLLSFFFTHSLLNYLLEYCLLII